jgi:hypothetical protein
MDVQDEDDDVLETKIPASEIMHFTGTKEIVNAHREFCDLDR